MSYLDKLNLRPGEKRIVVLIFIVLLVVLNFWFVWPQFNQWNVVKNDLANTRVKVMTFQEEIGRAPEYKKKIEILQGQGAGLMPEEAAVQLRRTIDTQVGQSGMVPNGINDQPSRTNRESIFEERAVTMGFINTGEKELVDFLYNISKDRSNIRVRDLSVRPDAQLQRLQGSMSLVATYQKKSSVLKTEPAKGPATTAPKPAEKPMAKPAEKPATKPAERPAINSAMKNGQNDVRQDAKPAAQQQKPASPQKAAPATPSRATVPTRPSAAKPGSNPPAPPKPLPRSIDVER